MARAPLAALDLIPVSSGSSYSEALRNTVDLVAATERAGYRRYWFAEHHLNPGVIGVSPALAIALAAGATDRIRLGSAGVQFGHRTPLSAAEEFGLLAAAYPGRIDAGIGRSFGRQPPADGEAGERAPELVAATTAYRAQAGGAEHTSEERTDNGLLLPKRFDFGKLASSSRLAHHITLLQQPGAYTPDYDEQIDDLAALLGGTYEAEDGIAIHAYPAEGAEVELWILGASGGSSARVAGERGLRFAASYHHSPSTVIDAVDAYRAAFRPSPDLHRPYISVSADVVVGPDDDTAQWLAAGYGAWVRSIRQGLGAIPFPAPEEAAALEWTDEERELVKDRVDTQLVGSPQTVVARLEQLQKATGADELAITTITHDPADRVRSYELLAEEWGVASI